MEELIISVLLVVLAFAMFMQFRNKWVYKQVIRLNYFDEKGHVISRYMDYEYIWLRFWVWDMEKFRRPDA